jgi:hypothetical protein
MEIPYATLLPNYPNPFNETTHISFKLMRQQKVSLQVFDMFGRPVETIINNETLPRGKYTKHFNAAQYNLTSGVYYFSLTGDGLNLKQKMLIVK